MRPFRPITLRYFTSRCNNTIYRLALPCLFKFFQVIVYTLILDHSGPPLVHYYCNISAPSRKRSIVTLKISFILMSGMSYLFMFPLPRRCQFSEGKHHLFLHAYPGFITPRLLKSKFITVSCRPPNAFQPSAYN